MRTDFLPFSPPLIGQEEIDGVVDTLRSGWITTGPKVKRFEQRFTGEVRAPAALGMASCTAAMHTALVAMGVGEGDEVIVPTWTFCATANVVEHVGATPVVVDIEPDTLNLDPSKVEAAMTPRTRVIMPVHFAGHPAPLSDLQVIAEQHDAMLLEDAAHGLGAEYGGKPIGGHGNPTAYSFYATKNLTTGEGGMLTGPTELIDDVRVLALHGMSREAWSRYQQAGTWRYDVPAPGFKYNLTDVQAAIGLAQLDRFAEMQRRRHEVARRYREAFATHDAFETPVTRGGVVHAWHLFVLRLRDGVLSIDRDQFFDELRERRIGASVHFIPLPMLSHYRDRYGLRLADFPATAANAERAISLPLHPGLTDADVDDVIEAALDIARRHTRCAHAA